MAIPLGLHLPKKYGNTRLIEGDCHTQCKHWVRNDRTILALQTAIYRIKWSLRATEGGVLETVAAKQLRILSAELAIPKGFRLPKRTDVATDLMGIATPV